MTITNLTITADRRLAVVSSDTFAAPPVANPIETRVSTAMGMPPGAAGRAPEEIKPAGFASKIATIAHLHAVTIGAGNTLPIGDFNYSISVTPPEIGDVRQLADYAPTILKRIKARYPTYPFYVILAGWVAERERIEAFAFVSGEDFRPVAIEPGHAMQPQPDIDCPAYAELYAAQPAALGGHDVEGFHRLLLRNQMHAWRAGKYPAGHALGGRFIFARIDARGVSIGAPKPL